MTSTLTIIIIASSLIGSLLGTTLTLVLSSLYLGWCNKDYLILLMLKFDKRRLIEIGGIINYKESPQILDKISSHIPFVISEQSSNIVEESSQKETNSISEYLSPSQLYYNYPHNNQQPEINLIIQNS